MGSFTYLRSFIKPTLLRDYRTLEELARLNVGATTLLKFLRGYALPWLSFRQATRANLSDNMDMVWNLALPIFIATGKKLYATMCVDHAYVSLSLLPPIRELWRIHRSCSQRGNIGRRAPWDLVQEQGNNFIANGLPDGAKRGDIDPFIEIFNGVQSVRPKLEAALGVAGSSLGESDVEVDDVERVVRVLNNLLPPESFFEENTTNPFGSVFSASVDDKEIRDHVIKHINKTEFELLEQPDW